MAKKKKVMSEQVEYSDIIHEVRDGVMMDVYLLKGKEVKVEVSKE